MIFNRIEHHQNSKNNMRPPWVMDTILMMDDEVEIGYIKMAYIPYDRISIFKEEPLLFLEILDKRTGLYKTDWEFLNSLSRKEHNRADNWYKHLRPDYEEQACFVAKHVLRKSRQTHEEYAKEKEFLANMSQEECKQYVEENKSKIWKWVVKNHGKAMHFHFARPDIQYVSVAPEYQGLGWGQKLYEEGSRWMNEKGMVLHSSNQSIQSEQAQRTWKRLSEKGKAALVAGTEDNPRYRYTEGVPDYLFVEKIIVKQPMPKKSKKTEALVIEKSMCVKNKPNFY